MNEEILKRLDVLASKLGVAADHLWGILVRESRVEAVTDSLFTLVMLGILWLCYLGIKKGIDDDDFEPLMLFSGVVALGCCIGILVCITSIPTEAFNPEYFAFHRLMEQLK